MNEFTPIPLGGELVVSGDTVIDTEVVEGANEHQDDSAEATVSKKKPRETTADPLDPDKTKKFEYNNWLKKNNKNEFLYLLLKEGAGLYLQNGLYYFRTSVESSFRAYAKAQVCDMLSNVLNRPINIGNAKDSIIKPFELMLIEKDRFNPFVKSEFYFENGAWYHNTFRPTYYMELDEKLPYKEPEAIIKLIRNLVLEDDRLDYFLNWVAVPINRQ